MKRIGILGAMGLETALLSKKIEGLEKETHGSFVFLTGKVSSIEVVLVVCGVGKVNAAACTQAMIDKYQVDCIINTGIAGAIDDRLNPLDLVISAEVTHHDVKPAQLTNLFPFTQFFVADGRLIESAKRACTEADIPGKCLVGRIASGEGFIEDDADRVRIQKQLQAYCVEMEGAAIAQVAYINKVPFVIIRTISDRADSGATMTYEEFKTKAADTSAEIVLAILRDLMDAQSGQLA